MISSPGGSAATTTELQLQTPGVPTSFLSPSILPGGHLGDLGNNLGKGQRSHIIVGGADCFYTMLSPEEDPCLHRLGTGVHNVFDILTDVNDLVYNIYLHIEMLLCKN